MLNLDPISRIERRLEVTETGCVEWTGSRSVRGYGQMTLNYRRLRVHRLVYELLVGPIPDGMVVCHRCDNPPCANPQHLFLGTLSDNVQDMIAKGRQDNGRRYRTHCIRGHELSAANVYHQPSGRRTCVPCRRQRDRARRPAGFIRRAS